MTLEDINDKLVLIETKIDALEDIGVFIIILIIAVAVWCFIMKDL